MNSTTNDLDRQAAERTGAVRLVSQARVALERGDRLAAADLARAALGLDRNCGEAHGLLSVLSLGGLPYRALLERAHVALTPRTYLEIGVAQGDTLALVRSPTVAIGVDPSPRIVRALPSQARIYAETSDAFFAAHDLVREFGGLPLDLAFIDGMHLFEFALRDFINIERRVTRASCVLIHDCYPLDAYTAARDRSTIFWTGDVWKVIVCLKKYRPDLQLHVLATPPSGLAVVRGLDPQSEVLASRYEEICKEYVPMPYEALGPDKPDALNLVPGDWETAWRVLQL